jgi:hypothetical protein
MSEAVQRNLERRLGRSERGFSRIAGEHAAPLPHRHHAAVTTRTGVASGAHPGRRYALPSEGFALPRRRTWVDPLSPATDFTARERLSR